MDFRGLRDSIGLVQNATISLQHHSNALLKRLAELSPRAGSSHLSLVSRKNAIGKVLKELRSINKKLAGFESGFLSAEGIKEREWYKHKGTAPGKVRQ